MRKETVLTEALFAKAGETYQKVSLPHTWNNMDGQDGGGDYWRGVGMYQIELPAPTEGKRQYIEFQGANHVATTYLNGRELGTHKGGFSCFRYDLTDLMKPEGNTLTVNVTNAPSDIYPQVADFTFFGGLYREVTFIETEQAHFDMMKGGTGAVFVTPRCTGKTRIDLFPVNAEGCTVKVTLKDAEGNAVACAQSEAKDQTTIIINLKDVHLWNGVKDPYCYTCEAVLEKDGAVQDEKTVTYGYRSFYVDPDKGFFLNGVSTPLRGVCRHQDRENMGWAITRKEHEEDVALIKEVGANTIRLAHYQHAQYFYDLCDHAGFVLWAEIPFISAFIETKEAYENTLSQMTELISQNYNHPAICFWGISNEITIRGESEPLYRNLCDLHALSKKLDPSRLTTMAEVSMVPMNSEHVYITDVVSYNHYFGWYGGEVEQNGPWFDEFHRVNPSRPLGVSEYGAESINTWHTVHPENHDYTEEYACYYHHEMLKTFETRPYLWATHCWNMFDFAADARDEGGVMGRNNKGLITYDRKVKKDQFYLYQAYWTSTPMVHVCGERFVDRAPDERTVTVYTNQNEVTLYVNGEAVAVKPAVDHAAVFENIVLKDGANTVTAKAGTAEGNTITLNAVAEHNFAYDLPEGNEGANWFNDPTARKPLEFPEGYYNIKDKMGVLLANPQTAAIVGSALKEIRGNSMMSSFTGKKKDAEEQNGEGLAGMLAGMSVDMLLKMAGKAVPAGTKRKLNELLTKIPRA